MVSTIRDKLLNAGMTGPSFVPPGARCVPWLPWMRVEGRPGRGGEAGEGRGGRGGDLRGDLRGDLQRDSLRQAGQRQGDGPTDGRRAVCVCVSGACLGRVWGVSGCVSGASVCQWEPRTFRMCSWATRTTWYTSARWLRRRASAWRMSGGCRLLKAAPSTTQTSRKCSESSSLRAKRAARSSEAYMLASHTCLLNKHTCLRYIHAYSTSIHACVTCMLT